jgi:hypothetical protein
MEINLKFLEFFRHALSMHLKYHKNRRNTIDNVIREDWSVRKKKPVTSTGEKEKDEEKEQLKCDWFVFYYAFWNSILNPI